MLDRQHIGRTLRRATRTVETGRLRFFLDVIGDKEGAFATHEAEQLSPGRSEDSCSPPRGADAVPRGRGPTDKRLRVPPTYLFCLEMMDDPDPLYWLNDLGVNLMHILHGQQRFDYHASAFAGDTLTFDASIGDIYDKKGGALQFIVKKTEVRNQDDVRIATLSSTVVYRDPAAARERGK
jgi:hypothetical protein